jgi:ectoine hydroxylase-related dioxygenase (phytanoyl-CoA dioxygenase family)
MTQYPLAEEQIEFYQQNGYIQLFDVLTPDELEDVRQSLDELMGVKLEKAFDRVGSNPEYDKVFYQKVNLWREHEGMKRFVFSPKLADVARRLARAKGIRLWHDHALVKMPGDSKPSPWHQDLPYWPMNEEGALSCWMALDDVDETNGCMAFIPGSHRVGRLEPINLINPQDIFGFEASGRLQGVKPAPMPMKAGSCTFHNGLTFHYAFPNQRDKPRRAMIVIYMPDGTTYSGKRHICTDGLGLEIARPIAGEVFPLLSEG